MIGRNMTVGEIETDVLEYIENWYANPPPHDRNHRPRGIPTFRSLQMRYGKQGIGHLTMYLTSHATVILWRDLSPPLAQALTNLLVEGKIHWHVGFAVFYEEGGPLPLPLAAWPVTKEYSKLHWLPVYFMPGASCDDDMGCPNYIRTEEEEEERFETT